MGHQVVLSSDCTLIEISIHSITKLFERSLENAALFGVEWDESAKEYSYTKKYRAYQFVGGLCINSSILFITYEAKTFYELTMSVIALASAIMSVTISAMVLLKLTALNKWIEKWQILLDESK